MKGMEALTNRLLELKFYGHQRNAFNQGRQWTLTFPDYVKAFGSGICAYSGVAMTFESNCPNTISIERVNNMKGYISGNVVFVCWKLNRAKNTLSLRQYVGDCRKVARIKKFA